MQHGSSITIMKKKMITSLQFTKKKNDYKFAIYNFSKT